MDPTMAFLHPLRLSSVASVALTSVVALGGGMGLLLEPKLVQALPLGQQNPKGDLSSQRLAAANACVRSKGGWLCPAQTAAVSPSPSPMGEATCVRAKGGWLCPVKTTTALSTTSEASILLSQKAPKGSVD